MGLLVIGCGDEPGPTAPAVPEQLVGTWVDPVTEGELTLREDWSYQWRTEEGGCLGSTIPSSEAGRFLLEGDAIRFFAIEVGEMGLFCVRDVEAPVLRGAVKYSVETYPELGEYLILEFLNAPIDLPVNGSFELERRR